MKNSLVVEKELMKRLGLDFDDDDPVWCRARKIIITGGWRAGKSTRGAARVLRQILRPTEKGLLWFLGPDYFQCREEFNYVVEWSIKLGLHVKHVQPNEGQCILETKTGWTIQTKSGKYPERLGSVAPDGIVMCEPGQVPEAVYIMALGRLAQKGGWLMAVGTLEADEKHPRWVWYEKLAMKWLANTSGPERAFTLPSWKNKVMFPGGENDPKLLELKKEFSPYTYARRIEGIPVGLEAPCFKELWEDEPRYLTSFNAQVERDHLKLMDGAIGVDFGGSDTHPSAVVVLQQDNRGRYWVMDCWTEVGGNNQAIESAVRSRMKRYGVRRGRVDPKQSWMAQDLGFEVALGTGPAPSEARIGLARGYIEDGYLLFNSDNPEVVAVFESMKYMSWATDNRGRQYYARDIGDDEGQACLYALEEMRQLGWSLPSPNELPTMRLQWKQLPAPSQGRT